MIFYRPCSTSTRNDASVLSRRPDADNGKLLRQVAVLQEASQVVAKEPIERLLSGLSALRCLSWSFGSGP